MIRSIWIVVIVAVFLAQYSESQFENGAKYWIKNVEDGSYLTASREFEYDREERQFYHGEVITLAWQGSPEQKWEILFDEHNITNTLSGKWLMSERKSLNELSVWIPKGEDYLSRKEWTIINVKNSHWHIKNDRTKKCIVNWGAGLEIGYWECETQSRNQLWIFNKVME